MKKVIDFLYPILKDPTMVILFKCQLCVICIYTVWCWLEISIYGKIEPRLVDSLIGILLYPIIYAAFDRGEK